MVKKNEFKKRSRYLAMLTALSLAFSNIGSCVNMVLQQESRRTEIVMISILPLKMDTYSRIEDIPDFVMVLLSILISGISRTIFFMAYIQNSPSGEMIRFTTPAFSRMVQKIS